MSTLQIIQTVIPGSSSPAKLDVDTPAILINTPYFDPLPEIYRKFIIAHEEGHYNIPTLNELEADLYAFNKIAGTERGSLQGMLNTLTDVLPFTTIEHTKRLINMYINIMSFNYQETGEQKYITEIQRIMNIYGYNIYGGTEIKTAYASETVEVPEAGENPLLIDQMEKPGTTYSATTENISKPTLTGTETNTSTMTGGEAQETEPEENTLPTPYKTSNSLTEKVTKSNWIFLIIAVLAIIVLLITIFKK